MVSLKGFKILKWTTKESPLRDFRVNSSPIPPGLPLNHHHLDTSST